LIAKAPNTSKAFCPPAAPSASPSRPAWVVCGGNTSACKAKWSPSIVSAFPLPATPWWKNSAWPKTPSSLPRN